VTTSDTVGASVRSLRKRNGWTVSYLAARCAELGGDAAKLTAPIIENIEHGRKRDGARTRDTTVDELVSLADAFAVPPSALLPVLGVRADAAFLLDDLIGQLQRLRDHG
jgi:transcriptional regulator with XRE-family HTH domain